MKFAKMSNIANPIILYEEKGKELVTAEKIITYRQQLHRYLNEKLLPFWLDHSIDKSRGGFLSYFDSKGKPTGKTDKTLICQLRMIFTYSGAARAGYHKERCLLAAEQGVEFVIKHFWDQQYDGWYWIADRNGKILDKSKIMYGQSFGVYSMAEYYLASGDPRGLEFAGRSFDVIQRNASETSSGGYWEMFHENWTLKPPGAMGGNRKTFDVHMHLMEAFTTLYEASRSAVHKRKLEEIIRLITQKMLHPQYGTGLAQFDTDITPLPAILFKNVWGSDRDVQSGKRPVDNTNYGHNIEFAWLLKRAIDILQTDITPFEPVIRKLVDHACEFGVDRQYGGIYVEGPSNGAATQTLKEFWQQAEALVGFIDAVLLFKKSNYWTAFENIYTFIWTKNINHNVGEWYALLNRDGTVKWDYLGHEWKINYHTVRSVIETIKRLEQLEKAVNTLSLDQ